MELRNLPNRSGRKFEPRSPWQNHAELIGGILEGTSQNEVDSHTYKTLGLLLGVHVQYLLPYCIKPHLIGRCYPTRKGIGLYT